MSLDILTCKIVQPRFANNAYKVGDYGYEALDRIREKGIICVKERRIGRNCLNHHWHIEEQRLSGSVHDNPIDYKKWDYKLSSMKIILLCEIQDKILKYLDISEEGSFLDKEALKERFDFLLISW
jgi:hypothetical protein